MTTADNDENLSEENAHVQELKRIFLDCDVDQNGRIGVRGLSQLCGRLKLAAFSSDIAERVLRGQECVDFLSFKDRFVALLPEIIDVQSGTVDPLLSRAIRCAQHMGYHDGQKLSRYETRLICEQTAELQRLSVVDINNIFEKADPERTGRVSIQQFLAQYRLQKRLSAEVHFIADSFVSSLNLFEALDPTASGSIDSHDLLEHWNKAGLRIDEGISVLKMCNQPLSGPINCVYLSAHLERELSRAAEDAPVSVKTAVVALHACIEHLRCSVKECESRSSHLQKQLQLANQRRTLLIEELEHNQLSIEQGYEKRLRDTDDRYRARLSQMEEKFRQDKKELHAEIERCEEELSRVRQSEASTRNKVSLLERQNARLNEETREYTETVQQLEQLNRQLRTELSKAMQPRPVDESQSGLQWKHKVELLVAHNKRLREKIAELSTLDRRRQKGASNIDPLTTKWTSTFRSQVLLIRNRRQMRGDTLDEMDSEPEAIFARLPRHRLMKRKDRRKRHEALANRLTVLNDSEDSAAADKKKLISPAASVKQFEQRFDRLKDDHRKELQAVKAGAAKTLADALNDQEKQLNAQFEKERRQFDSNLREEKIRLERAFAEEKMKTMGRLQEDFDTELQRIASAVHRPENPATTEQYKRQIKSLESSLEGQRNAYEKRLSDMRDKYKTSLRAHTSHYHIDRNATNFISLMEKYRNSDVTPSSSDLLSPRSLGTEKKNHIYHQPFQRSLSSMSRCERCEQSDAKLRELYHTLAGEQSQAESGIEDMASSTGSHLDDKIVLKREVRRLKGRIEAAKERVTELRVLSSMAAGNRYKSSLGGSEGSGEWRRNPTRWSEMTGQVERLESEKLILEARLSEAQQLIKNLVEQYKNQLEETSRLGSILKDVYSHNPDTANAT